MSAAVTRVWAIQEIANPRRACDASRMTTFGAVSIVWRMSTTPILTGYRATNTRSLLPPVAGLKLLFLVRVPAARSSLGLRDVPDVGDRRAARARRWRHAPTPPRRPFASILACPRHVRLGGNLGSAGCPVLPVPHHPLSNVRPDVAYCGDYQAAAVTTCSAWTIES